MTSESTVTLKHAGEHQLATTPSEMPPIWVRWIIPSFHDLIFVVLFFSLAFGTLSARLLWDGGTGWHLRTGQIILATHSVPHSDPFSISTAGRTWYAWEWLSDAAMGAAFNWAGLNGIVLLAALVIAATFTLFFRMLRRQGTGLFVSVGLVLLTVAVSTVHLLARPHVATWLLTLVWLGVLELAHQDKPARLWWLIPLMILWVNLHGGFLLGMVLLGIYWIDAFLAAQAGNADSASWLRTVSAVSIGTVLASLANPYSYHLYGHLYQYLKDPFLMSHIQEFQSPNFHGIPERCFAALVLLAILGPMFSRAKLAPRNALILLFAVYTGFAAARNLPVSSLLIAIVIGPIWSEALCRLAQEGAMSTGPQRMVAGLRAWQSRMEEMDSNLRGGAWIVIAVVLVFWMTARGGSLGDGLHMPAAFDKTRFPVQAVDFLQANNIREPVFSTDQWGGYLIYRLYPQKAMVDDRHDLYGVDFFKSYLKIVHVEPGWAAQLDSLHANRVLVPAQSSLAGALEMLPEWKVEYRDKTAVLFKKVTAPAAS